MERIASAGNLTRKYNGSGYQWRIELSLSKIGSPAIPCLEKTIGFATPLHLTR